MPEESSGKLRIHWIFQNKTAPVIVIIFSGR